MTNHLNISVSARLSHVLVLLDGECDAATTQPLRETLTDQSRLSAPMVVADLSRLRFIDTAVAHALVEAHDSLAGRGKRLILLAPQLIVARVLELTGVDQLIPVHQTLDDVLDIG